MEGTAWFDTSAFIPHGHCFLWTPALLVLHVGADVVIGAAYFAIPFCLHALARRRPDLPFRRLFLWFSVFIGLCGLTHWMAAWNIWHADYWIEGLLKSATALASVPAAIALWRAVPAILALPSHAQLAASNEELRTSNSELEAFVSTAAHDLRSPLQGVRFLLETMLTTSGSALSDQQRGGIATAVTELQRMSAAVEARLKLARLAREPLRLESLDVTQLAARIVDRLRRSTPEQRVDVEIQPGMRLDADPALFETLLENLLANAWKFTSRREDARVEIALLESAEARVLSVRDNGIGFDMADAHRLFRPLQRLPGAADFPGQGIGLATVARIAERHGGRVDADGTRGQGAQFFVRLPHAPGLRRRTESAAGRVRHEPPAAA